MLSALGVYAVFAWGIRMALANPFYGVALYEGLALLRPQEVWSWSLSGSRLSLYAAIATLIGWLAHKSKLAAPRWTAHHVVLIAFWLLLALSVFDAHDQDIAWGSLTSFSKFFVFFFPLMALTRTPGQIRVLMWLVTGTIGYLAFSENFGYFTVGQSAASREVGTIGGDNNHYAVFFVLAIPVTHALFLEEKDPRLKALCFVLIPMMMHSVMLTYSRGGMLGLLIIAPFLLYYSRRQPLALVAFLVLALVGARLAGPSVRERFMTIRVGEEDGSIKNRNLARQAAVEIMKHRPLTGVGLGCYRYVANDYYADVPRGMMAHNSYYEMGAEAGVPALIAYLTLIGVTFLKLWKVRMHALRRGVSWAYHYAAGVETSMLGAGVCCYFLSNSSFELFYFLISVAAALDQTVFSPVEEKTDVSINQPGMNGRTTPSDMPIPLFRGEPAVSSVK